MEAGHHVCVSGQYGCQQRRDRLRRDAAQCWVDVDAVINAEDPEGLLEAGAPPDEYASEVEDFVRLVRDESVTPQRVLEVWERWFGPDSSLSRRPEVLDKLTVALARISPTEPQSPSHG